MPITSKFDGKCYVCGKTWTSGTQIDTTGQKNSKGKDAWCVDGHACSGGGGQQTITQGVTYTEPAKSDETKLDFAESALKRFIAIIKEQEIDPAGCRDQFGAVFNTAIMQRK